MQSWMCLEGTKVVMGKMATRDSKHETLDTASVTPSDVLTD